MGSLVRKTCREPFCVDNASNWPSSVQDKVPNPEIIVEDKQSFKRVHGGWQIFTCYNFYLDLYMCAVHNDVYVSHLDSFTAPALLSVHLLVTFFSTSLINLQIRKRSMGRHKYMSTDSPNTIHPKGKCASVPHVRSG